MFNPMKPVYQIGVDDGGGSVFYQHDHIKPRTPTKEELSAFIEAAKPKPKITIRKLDGDDRWTVGDGSELSLAFNGDYNPVVAEGETTNIRILELFIKCKKIRGIYAIIEIKDIRGAVYNTLVVPREHKLAGMMRVSTLTPVNDFYR